MYLETLMLEIHANKAGWRIIKPPLVQGQSGGIQKFSFLATDETCTYGFDIYDDVSEEDVIGTYVKRLDTNALTIIVNLRGRASKEVSRLADNYGITILGPAEIDSFFEIDAVGIKDYGQRAAMVPR